MSKLVFYKPLLVSACLLICFESQGAESSDCRAFLDTDDTEIKRLESQFSERHQEQSRFHGVRRYRLARIDVPCLLSLLMKDTEIRKQGGDSNGLKLELFDDMAVEVVVDTWIESPEAYGHTFTSGFGRPIGDYPLSANFTLHYQEEGKFSASVSLDLDRAFLIESLQDSNLYKVTEVDPVDRID